MMNMILLSIKKNCRKERKERKVFFSKKSKKKKMCGCVGREKPGWALDLSLERRIKKITIIIISKILGFSFIRLYF